MEYVAKLLYEAIDELEEFLSKQKNWNNSGSFLYSSWSNA